MTSTNTQSTQTMLPSEKIQIAHDAVMLEDARQVLKNTRKVAELNRTSSQFGVPESGDDMLVLGDNTTHVYPAPRTDWAKLILGAGLLASGVGAPVGGYMILQGLLNPPAKKEPPKTQSISTDQKDPLTIEYQQFDWQLDGGVDQLTP